jgi:hypothetical protein
MSPASTRQGDDLAARPARPHPPAHAAAAATGCRRALTTLVDEYPAQRLRAIVNK